MQTWLQISFYFTGSSPWTQYDTVVMYVHSFHLGYLVTAFPTLKLFCSPTSLILVPPLFWEGNGKEKKSSDDCLSAKGDKILWWIEWVPNKIQIQIDRHQLKSFWRQLNMFSMPCYCYKVQLYPTLLRVNRLKFSSFSQTTTFLPCLASSEVCTQTQQKVLTKPTWKICFIRFCVCAKYAIFATSFPNKCLYHIFPNVFEFKGCVKNSMKICMWKSSHKYLIRRKKVSIQIQNLYW